MATRNEITVNLAFTNMFSSTFVKTYDDTAIKVPNMSHLKNNSQYFGIHVSWDCLFNMSVSSFSMQQTPHHSQYCRFLLNIVSNHIFYRYFLKILVILSSPPFYSTQIKVSDPVPDYILNDSKFLRIPLMPLAALISMSMPLLKIETPCMITVVLSPPMPLLFVISICDCSTSKWLGMVCDQCCDVPWLSFYWSPYTQWEIFSCRCWVPYLLYPPYAILWPTISSCWVGSYKTTVHITILLFSIKLF